MNEINAEKIVENSINEVENEMAVKRECIISESLPDFSNIKELLNDTHSHLYYYSTIDETLGLIGNKYYPIKKFLCYFVESALNNAMRIEVGSNNFDNRINGLIISTAGQGKTVIKNTLKHFLKNGKETVIEGSGIIHPEQLIGKTKKDKKGIITDIKGYLGAEIMFHDETNSIINEKAPMADQCQRIKRIAMDCYEYNEVNKKLVDETIAGSLAYFPETRFMDFYHPENFASVFFDKGTFRRYFIFELEKDMQIDINDSVKSLFSKKTNYNEIKEHFNELRKKKRASLFTFEITNECLEIIAKYIKNWNSFCLTNKNSKVRRFGEITFHSIKEYFLKIVALLHLHNDEMKSNEKLTKLACIDCIHFLISSLECITSYGNLQSTSDVWRGAKDMEIYALEYLYRNNAINEELSEISVLDYIDVIGELYGVMNRQAFGILSKLKKNGWVKTKKVGRVGSKVWITFRPKIYELINNDEKLENLLINEKKQNDL